MMDRSSLRRLERWSLRRTDQAWKTWWIDLVGKESWEDQTRPRVPKYYKMRELSQRLLRILVGAARLSIPQPLPILLEVLMVLRLPNTFSREKSGIRWSIGRLFVSSISVSPTAIERPRMK